MIVLFISANIDNNNNGVHIENIPLRHLIFIKKKRKFEGIFLHWPNKKKTKVVVLVMLMIMIMRVIIMMLVRKKIMMVMAMVIKIIIVRMIKDGQIKSWGEARKVSRREDKEEGKKREESEGNNFALINIRFISTDRSGRGICMFGAICEDRSCRRRLTALGCSIIISLLVFFLRFRPSCLPGFYVLGSVALSV